MQKKQPALTPDQEKALLYAKRRPVEYDTPVKKPQPAPKPPEIALEVQICQYASMPDFGFDVISVTINGVNVQFYRACILHNGKMVEIPMQDGQAFMSLDAANAFAEQEKLTGQFRRMMLAKGNALVLPGSQDFKPPRLH